MKRNVLIVVLVVVGVIAVAYLKSDSEPAAEPKEQLPRLVELGGGTCKGCKDMAPIIEALRKEYADRLLVESIHVIKEADRARAYNWHLIPCQVFLDSEGKELWRHEGFISKADILAKWAELGFKFAESSEALPTSQASRQDADVRDGQSSSQDGSNSSLLEWDPQPGASVEPLPGAKVVAYYFHRTRRCPTCVTIEKHAKRSIEEAFQDELANGLLEFRPVNIEKPGNEHFEDDYKLRTQALVLVRFPEGKPADWKNLPAVWEFVGDYGAFAEYVRGDVTRFLSEGASDPSVEPSNAR